MDFLQKLGSLPLFIIMFVIIYFLMIRPQITQQKKHTNLINNLKLNDKVITNSGIVGKISSFQGKNKLIIITADNTKLTILKSHISSLDN